MGNVYQAEAVKCQCNHIQVGANRVCAVGTYKLEWGVATAESRMVQRQQGGPTAVGPSTSTSTCHTMHIMHTMKKAASEAHKPWCGPAYKVH